MRLSRGCPLTPPAVTEGGRQSGSVPESGITSERMTEPASQALVGKYTGGKEKGGGGGGTNQQKKTPKKQPTHMTPVTFPMHSCLFSQFLLVCETNFIVQTNPK